jgi:tRNA wybutosine-synthesizing protein 2
MYEMPVYRAFCVPAEDGEKMRQKVVLEGLIDHARKIQEIWTEKGLFLEIPVSMSAGEKIGEYAVYEQKKPEFLKKPLSLKECLAETLTEEELEYVPSGWHVLGDIIIVRIPEILEAKKVLIAQALLLLYPKCKSIVRDLGIEGQFRHPKREFLIGSSTETTNKEHGCFFKQDVTKVMYSRGNLEERRRMSRLGKGEVVVDMFAGIGYFSIPMAVHSHPEKIISIEINPESFAYLQENIKLNRVEDIITPLLGNCAKLVPEGKADRVLMGYVGTTHQYLEPGIRALKKSGGILHYHETVPEKLLETRPEERVRKAACALGKKVEVLSLRRIKKYSPGVIHVVLDARIFET